MQKLRFLFGSLVLAALFSFSARAALAQDPAKVAPEGYKVTSENSTSACSTFT